MKLQAYDPDHITAWKQICEVSSRGERLLQRTNVEFKGTYIVTEFKKVYNRLDIENLVDRGESFYNDMMKGMVQKLKDMG